ncbi:PHB depolymerase family esterase [Tropicimonas sp. IMCC34043]|uniref:extracellular catalytic domain type 1 short-chain-length polyhydroxyalkanoate depolymerase n=1 Tax=Tropicimonas sp. IMCC34043 TaxID=2248760 RepID=UPI000E27F546|nr:PHB depolymerase family esterase [Tropicimonas sp. IMCC34043]
MTHFFTGASRRPAAHARPDHREAAARLVQETLARHGLAGNIGVSPGAAGASGLGEALASALQGALSPQGLGRIAPVADATPADVNFTRHSFACDAGSRDYRLYVPESAKDGATALVVMLHGCTQTPEDFAAGTGMNALADAHGVIVVYPAQARGANAQSCWNWFGPGDQVRDRGEPAIIAGLTREVIASYRIPSGRAFVAGLSAGGAMAVILGQSYPDLYAGVGVHSGLPYASASDVASAFSAMGGNPRQAAQRPRSMRHVPTIVFHGTADATVHPTNGEFIARDALSSEGDAQIQTTERGAMAGRAFERRITSRPDGRTSVEHWEVDGLAHAWSGGRPAGSYTDPKGPDASAEMIRFFLELDDGGK